MTETLDASPAELTITIYSGDTFKTKVWLADETDKPIDLSGYSAELYVRASTVATTTDLELSTSSGELSIPSQNGNWQGTWSDGTNYSEDDVVLHNDIYWIATSDTSTEPKAGASDWDHAPLGRVDITISSSNSASLPLSDRRYDLELTDSNGDVETWLSGTLSVKGDIS